MSEALTPEPRSSHQLALQIVRLKALHGPNRWSRLPVIQMRVDLGQLDQRPTDTLADFRVRLADALPGLADHTCSTGRAGGFLARMAQGTWLGHVTEHVALEVQRQAGGRSTRGKTRRAPTDGVYDVVFAYDDEATGLAAARAAVKLVNDLLIPGTTIDGRPIVADIRAVLERGRLGLSTQAIVDAARRRDIPWFRLNDRNLVQLGWGVHQRRIRATVTSATGLIAAESARDKDETCSLLGAAGVPVPTWRLARSGGEARAAARRIGYPVVLKPVDGNHGRGVELDLTDEAAVSAAFERASAASRRGDVIVQRQISGRDHRLLVVGGRLVACAERVPASVVGDGRSSVTQLVERENADPRRGRGHAHALTRLRLDEAAHALLLAQGLRAADIPAEGRRVALSRSANLSTGGTSIDRTDEVHPDVARMAELAARVIGLDVAGIDLVTTDIGLPLRETGGGIVELNAAPGFRMHTQPSVGRPRDVGGAVVDHLFGRGAEGRIPIAAVTGSNGKTTTVRLLAHLLTTAGVATGSTTTERIEADGLLLRSGDMAGPASARLLLANPTIEAAVLEVARGGILRDGLGYDYNDVAVVTNVTGDHLGLDDIDTLDDLAAVKAVIVDAVPRTGTAVLNADDPLVLAMASRCRGAVALITTATADVAATTESDRAATRAVRAHRRAGGMVGHVEVVDGIESVVARRGETRLVSVTLIDIPLTWGGAARMHVANVLGAACAALALGIDPADIEAGLRSFAASPGRVERRLVDGREIVLDYGHNIAALEALRGLIERIAAGRRVIGVVSMPGDRRDEDRARFGSIAGAMFDLLFVAEPAVRGRAVGQAAGIMIDAARASGGPDRPTGRAGEPIFIPDEADAARAAFEASSPGDLLVLCVADGGRAMAALAGGAPDPSAARADA